MRPHQSSRFSESRGVRCTLPAQKGVFSSLGFKPTSSKSTALESYTANALPIHSHRSSPPPPLPSLPFSSSSSDSLLLCENPKTSPLHEGALPWRKRRGGDSSHFRAPELGRGGEKRARPVPGEAGFRLVLWIDASGVGGEEVGFFPLRGW